MALTMAVCWAVKTADRMAADWVHWRAVQMGLLRAVPTAVQLVRRTAGTMAVRWVPMWAAH